MSDFAIWQAGPALEISRKPLHPTIAQKNAAR